MGILDKIKGKPCPACGGSMGLLGGVKTKDLGEICSNCAGKFFQLTQQTASQFHLNEVVNTLNGNTEKCCICGTFVPGMGNYIKEGILCKLCTERYNHSIDNAGNKNNIDYSKISMEEAKRGIESAIADEKERMEAAKQQLIEIQIKKQEYEKEASAYEVTYGKADYIHLNDMKKTWWIDRVFSKTQEYSYAEIEGYQYNENAQSVLSAATTGELFGGAVGAIINGMNASNKIESMEIWIKLKSGKVEKMKVLDPLIAVERGTQKYHNLYAEVTNIKTKLDHIIQENKDRTTVQHSVKTQSKQVEKTINTVSETWDCSCGQKGLLGKFCSNCGSKKPEKAVQWTCTCGEAEITGNFCSYCGARRPE